MQKPATKCPAEHKLDISQKISKCPQIFVSINVFVVQAMKTLRGKVKNVYIRSHYSTTTLT